MLPEHVHAKAEAIREVARDLGVDIGDLTIGQYRDAGHACGNRWWGAAKRLAMESDARDLVVPEGHHVKGVSALIRTPEGIRWVKTDRVKESREAALVRALRDLPDEVPDRRGTVTPPSMSASADDVLAVYPMGDPHIGLLAWAPETGEDWDLRKAEDIMGAAIRGLTSDGPPASRALICQLGDFYHSDNAAGVTSRSGHSLDVDGRWAKVLRVGVRIMADAIDAALAAHQHVTVINAIGNHDDHSSVFLSVALDAYYRHEPRVTIDLSPAMHRYHRFGRCLVGVTHGHTSKHADLESIMASDQPAAWGETRHRYWYCGHIHHTRKIESRGCVVESFRTLAAKDAWHAGQGYRSGRDMCRIALHREHGEVARSIVSAGYLQAQMQEAA